jgi:hypothetical protein
MLRINFLILSITIGLFLSGCSSTPVKWKCEAETSGGGVKAKCTVEGTFKHNKFRETLEAVSGIPQLSLSELKNIDLSLYSIRLTGVNGATIPSKKVTLYLHSEQGLISYQKFDLVKTRGVFKLKHPNEIKRWVENFYDVTDTITFEFDTAQSESGNILISAEENGYTRASTSIFVEGGIDNNISWDEK